MSSPAVSRRLRLGLCAAWITLASAILPWIARGQEARKESPSNQATSPAAAQGVGDAQRWLSSVQDVLAGAIERNQRSVVSIARVKKRVASLPVAPYDRAGTLEGYSWRQPTDPKDPSFIPSEFATEIGRAHV